MLVKRKGFNSFAMYNGVSQKTFKSALSYLVEKEYKMPFGKLILNHFCDAIEKLVESYYTNRTHIKPGQFLWFAVEENEFPAYAKSIKDTKMVPVVLSLLTKDDVELLKNGGTATELRKKVIPRLFYEAKKQRGVLTEADISAIFKIGRKEVSEIVRLYEKETNNIIPRRGTIHDMGRSVTHKKIICYKKFVDKLSNNRIARETHHSLDDVERYIKDFKRVKYCLLKKLNEEEMSMLLKMSKSLVLEYVSLINEFNIDKNIKLDFDLISSKIEYETPYEF